jgi:hypothetical protein
MTDLNKKSINDFSKFFDFLEDGELCLYVPKSGLTVNPPDGASNAAILFHVWPVTEIEKGSFIAGDKYYEQYKDTCYIYRDKVIEVDD